MFSPKAFIAHLRSMSGYIAFSFILLLAGIVIGGTNQQLEAYITSQLQALGNISNAIDQSNNPAMSAFAFIFLNNAIKSILIMYLGAAFALIPIFFLVVNGLVLGYVFTHHDPLYSTFELIARGILPHGILEIPAIVIAAAYGIKFGTLTFSGIGNLIQRKKGFGAVYEQFAIRTVPLMVALVVALLAAAAIEATITPWLLKGMKM
ncbi:stage II sporulation protein M [Paenibacillus pinihumi]|uniref:stage II sporulation protein M n=1 Tax=Paenibacillus pinihumi TaxID=669462 RepID=UPI0003FFE05A|nr:stage II sporulation protein M [Paenibacillus pinihumi]